MDRIIRHQPLTTVLLRAEESGSGRKAVGYASVFNSWTTLYKDPYSEVREVIRAGAFRNAIVEGQDVRALWNHDSNHPLGRTTAGTLRLAEDGHGLKVVIDLPDTTVGRDLIVSMGRGDVSQMSFAFIPREGGEVATRRREGGIDVTEVQIKDVDLYDVSIVTFPAYKDAKVALWGGLTTAEGRACKMAEVRSRVAEVESKYRRAAHVGR